MRAFAKATGIPFGSLGRIEIGITQQPQFHSIRRLVAATGGEVTACEILLWHYENSGDESPAPS